MVMPIECIEDFEVNMLDEDEEVIDNEYVTVSKGTKWTLDTQICHLGESDFRLDGVDYGGYLNLDEDTLRRYFRWDKRG
jgi:hypothetical protein